MSQPTTLPPETPPGQAADARVASPAAMTRRRPVGIAMNGVTGRMGLNQHLVRSVLAIRAAGGVPAADGSLIWPEPLLVGRNADKLRGIAEDHGLERWTTDLDEALADRDIEVYFDAQTTQLREAGVRAAIAAGKHVYCEKPTAERLVGALELARLAKLAGVKHGVVHDKLFLPGLRKLRRLIDADFFGRILSVQGRFGYWVFEGGRQPAQRPSWNYRREAGGGIVADMFCHWRYLLEGLFGPIRSVQCVAATHIPERVDEAGTGFRCTADDAAYGIFELDGGIVAQINASWATRVYRDELLEFQVDGTEGSAVAGLHGCRVQHRATTPRAVWNPDIPSTDDFRRQWLEVPDNERYDNAFKVQWELFLRHVVDDIPWTWDLVAGAKGVQLSELGLQAAAAGCRLPVPGLTW